MGRRLASAQAGDVAPLPAEAGLDVAYYANSYVCRPAAGEGGEEMSVIAWSEHEGDRFPAAVRRGGVVGAQFHPEKSSAAGLAFVRAFVASLGAGDARAGDAR